MTMIHECVSRGHKVALCTPGNLTIRDSITSAFCNVIQPKEKISNNIKVFYKNCSVQRVFAMQVVVAEEFLGLLVADAAVDQNQPRIDFHQERAHRPGAEVLGIGGIGPRPKLLWNHPKHRAAIQLEIPGVNRVQSHGVKVATAPRS